MSQQQKQFENKQGDINSDILKKISKLEQSHNLQQKKIENLEKTIHEFKLKANLGLKKINKERIMMRR